MKIERIEAIGLSAPLAAKPANDRFKRRDRLGIVTRVFTDDGIVGQCFTSVSATLPGEIVRIIHDEMAPLLLGRDPLRIEACWEAMLAPVANDQRDRRLAVRAQACVDAALWDVVGKAAGAPLYRLWGGYHDALDVVILGGIWSADRSLADYGDEMDRIRALGAKGCKFKVGRLSPLTPEGDADRIRVARAAAGDDFILVADANAGWKPREALDFARRVADLGLAWIEEPCPWYDDREGMATVRAIGGIPVASGQMEITAQGCRDMMVARAIDVCNFDASWGGGPTAFLRVAGMAACFGVEINQHQEPQIGLHLTAAFAHGRFLEAYYPGQDPIYYEMVANRPEFRDGRVALPQDPGWGLEFDEAFIARYRV